MSEHEDRMQSLESHVAELAGRLARLETGTGGDVPRGPRAPRDGADLSFLERLRTRPGGAIAYAGAAPLGGRDCLWIKEHAVPDVVELDPDRLARALGALGHPARLILLRALAEAPRSSQQLQEALGVSSPGQLYHHLKELLATGLVSQTRRSHYEVADHQVVPLLTVLAATSDLVASTPPPEEV
jgi:DNA-binding transcriptional ArsR family regulator